MLRLGGAVDPENAIEALRALLRAVRELRAAGPKDADVERAKATLRGAMRQQQSSSAGIASNIAAGVLSAATDPYAFVNQLHTQSAADSLRLDTKTFACVQKTQDCHSDDKNQLETLSTYPSILKVFHSHNEPVQKTRMFRRDLNI